LLPEPNEEVPMKIEDVEGIGPTYAEKLTTAGVKTTDDLLSRGASQSGRDNLSNETGISERLLLEWVNHADLMRIDGVGSEFADLLEAGGVDSCAELARRNAKNLAETLAEVVAARPGIVRRTPSEDMIRGWIEQAEKLAKVVTH